ncbi:MAG: FapA family protein [Helicobacteraceae bacterium]|jgi:hypothetical protein|nr:FapA family protein [Helicobacteraceae bacterium]
MGLLDNIIGADAPGAAEKRFTSLRLETDNVPATIKEISAEYKIAPSEIDLMLLSTQTFVKMPESDKPVEFAPAMIGRISEDPLLNNSKFFIRQVHRITFKQLTPHRDLRLDIDVMANSFRTRAIANIKPESKLHYFNNLREWLIDELNKIKLRYGMILGVREGTLLTDIGNLVNKIRVHNCVNEPFKVTLCDWIAPTPTIDDDLILHFKNKKAPGENERIDYADRGFIKTVEIGELLVEYVKPKSGVAGRDFRGAFIPALKPKTRFVPILLPDLDSIEVKEDENSIQYFSKKKGYVTYRQVESRLFISDTLELESVDFKNTGNINAGIDKDVKISVRGGSSYEDHIGPNTKIEASEIEVAGSVASGAQIKVERLKVDGQTHSTSVIYAKEAEIGVHKGMLEGKTAKIDRLEHGKVNAETVEVNRVLGGMIWARTIKIGTLHSHATLVASESITIDQLVGGENRFFIEAAATKEDRCYFGQLVEKNKKMQKEIEEYFTRYNRKRLLLLQNKTQIEQIRERIDSDRLAGKTSPSIFTDRYKQYLEEMKKTRLMHDELENMQGRRSVMENEIDLIQSRVLNALVINNDCWRNYNEVRFRIAMPPKEIVFVPLEDSRPSRIHLELTGLEEYTIRITEWSQP